MVTEEQLKQFLGCGQAAQKAVDEIITKHVKEKVLEAAAKKAAATGSHKDLQVYLKLRRDTL